MWIYNIYQKTVKQFLKHFDEKKFIKNILKNIQRFSARINSRAESKVSCLIKFLHSIFVFSFYPSIFFSSFCFNIDLARQRELREERKTQTMNVEKERLIKKEEKKQKQCNDIVLCDAMIMNDNDVETMLLSFVARLLKERL